MANTAAATIGGWVWEPSQGAWCLIVWIGGDASYRYIVPGPATAVVAGTQDLTQISDIYIATPGPPPESPPSGGG